MPFSGDNSKKTEDKVDAQGNSEANSDIATSLKSMEIKLTNTLGEINTRVKKLEQTNTTENKGAVVTKKTVTDVKDLTQPIAQHSQEENGNVTESDNDNQDEDDTTRPVPDGHTRVKLPSNDGGTFSEPFQTH